MLPRAPYSAVPESSVLRYYLIQTKLSRRCSEINNGEIWVVCFLVARPLSLSVCAASNSQVDLGDVTGMNSMRGPAKNRRNVSQAINFCIKFLIKFYYKDSFT